MWRNLVDEDTGELTIDDEPASDELRRVLHRTIDSVRTDMDALSFNTSIARITELNNELTKLDGPTPREVAEPLVRMLSPLVPHIAEELWRRMGRPEVGGLCRVPRRRPGPARRRRDRDPGADQGQGPVSHHGAAGADDATLEAAALADPRIQELLDGGDVRKVIVVPGRLVNIITS